jgi:hypothetical protein
VGWLRHRLPSPPRAVAPEGYRRQPQVGGPALRRGGLGCPPVLAQAPGAKVAERSRSRCRVTPTSTEAASYERCAGRRAAIALDHSASWRAASKSASDLPASMTAQSHPASSAAGIHRLGSKIGISNLLLCHRHQRRPGSSTLRPLQRLGERALSPSTARCRPRRSPLARRPGTRRRALAQAERLGAPGGGMMLNGQTDGSVRLAT